MVGNLGEIRDLMWNLADWSPGNAKHAQEQTAAFVNQAQRDLAFDLPFLFNEQLVMVPLYPDTRKGDTSDTLEVTDDQWVLKGTLLNTDPLAAEWNQYTNWDGRTIFYKGPDDAQWREGQVREAWEDGTARYVTLFQPHNYPPGTVGIDWKILSHHIALHPDVVRLKSLGLLYDGGSTPITVINQGELEHTWSGRIPEASDTFPRTVYRRPMSRIQAPAFTPAVAPIEGVWVGERTKGDFEYLLTYVIGRGDGWHTSGGPRTNATNTTDASRHMPWVESAPSAYSDPIHPGASTVIQIQLPNIDRMLGFDDASTDRYRRTGIRKRIYIRRLSDDSGNVEVRQRWYLLDEVEGDVTTYIDDGSVLADLMNPLNTGHGTQHLSLLGSPDRRYDVSLRVIMAPPPLTVPTDAPSLEPVAIGALIQKALTYLYKAMGNSSDSARAEVAYIKATQDVRSSYGMGRPQNKPRRRKFARVRRGRGTNINQVRPEWN
jgi:hypothetical protein